MAVKKSSKGLQNLKHEVNVKENVKVFFKLGFNS